MSHLRRRSRHRHCRRRRRRRGRRRRRPARYMRADFSFCHQLAAALDLSLSCAFCYSAPALWTLLRWAAPRGTHGDNETMGWDGMGLRRTEDSVNVSLCSLSSFSRSLFLFLLSPFSQHTHLSAFIILPSLFRTQPIASTRTHSTLILFLSLSCYSSFYPSLFSVRRFRDRSLFNAFPFLLVTVKRAEYANAAILCYACGPRVWHTLYVNAT